MYSIYSNIYSMSFINSINQGVSEQYQETIRESTDADETTLKYSFNYAL